MASKNLSEELTSVFSYIKDVILKGKSNTVVDEYTYVSAVLMNKNSLAYKSMSSIVMETTLDEMTEFYRNTISFSEGNGDKDTNPYSLFNKYMDDCDGMCRSYGLKCITSSMLLLSIVKRHVDISRQFREFSITTVQLTNSVAGQSRSLTSESLSRSNANGRKNPVADRQKQYKPVSVVNVEVVNDSNGGIGKNLKNLTKMAENGEIEPVIGYEKYYDDIIAILSKMERNNVALCGVSGVGKTSTAMNLANVMLKAKSADPIHEKVLVEINFSELVIGTPYKGAFEQKFYAILNEARSAGNYVFFIDNLHLLLNGMTKYAETDIENLLEKLMAEPSIPVICTMTQSAYNSIQKKSPVGKYLQGIVIEEPTNEEAEGIINAVRHRYEAFHGVRYTPESVSSCVELARKHMAGRALPDSAMDIIDYAGALSSTERTESTKVKVLRDKLSEITREIDAIKSSPESNGYERIDELTKMQISVKSKISIAEKEDILEREPYEIHERDIRYAISKRTGIPMSEITENDKCKLRGLSEKIRQSVIGQDEAVEEVCRAVKRHKVRLGEPERPNVLMFLGPTGCGKTLLAKQIAKEVYGNDKYLVRIDMSEYSDKTSVNKITGSAMGYVGYDDKTTLVKALEKMKSFVLLLDEFEKADEQVQNIFLGIFDEGRFTSSHSDEYDMRNVTIILTSNVGARESSLRGGRIGFSDDGYDMTREIIDKELKKQFRPELLNRIQNTVYFNKLKDENLRSIVEIEIGKVKDKVERLGYHLADDITKTAMVDRIYEAVLPKRDFGGRPIVNEVQRNIEDNIVNYLIDNEVEKGHIFTYDELCGFALR